MLCNVTMVENGEDVVYSVKIREVTDDEVRGSFLWGADYEVANGLRIGTFPVKSEGRTTFHIKSIVPQQVNHE